MFHVKRCHVKQRHVKQPALDLAPTAILSLRNLREQSEPTLIVRYSEPGHFQALHGAPPPEKLPNRTVRGIAEIDLHRPGYSLSPGRPLSERPLCGSRTQ